MKDVHKNIKKYRLSLGLTQTELAKMLGYADKSMIAKIEAGTVDLPQSRIEAFARALGVTVTDLTGWTEQRKQDSFSYCMEQQMRLLGYVVIYDAEGNVILTHAGAEYEITDQQLKELEARVALFLKVGLQEIIDGSRKIGG